MIINGRLYPDPEDAVITALKDVKDSNGKKIPVVKMIESGLEKKLPLIYVMALPEFSMDDYGGVVQGVAVICFASEKRTEAKELGNKVMGILTGADIVILPDGSYVDEIVVNTTPYHDIQLREAPDKVFPFTAFYSLISRG